MHRKASSLAVLPVYGGSYVPSGRRVHTMVLWPVAKAPSSACIAVFIPGIEMWHKGAEWTS
jgi:hypothetical protein